MTTNQSNVESIKEYYGEILKDKNDLKTGACCPVDSMPERLKQIIEKIHPEVQEKFYGCGSPIPPLIEGKTVLDLGCGTGRDCFILSKLVGTNGKVIGIDMTDSQLTVAKRYEKYHQKQFDLPNVNTIFIQGMMEDLASIGIESDTIDVVISNCVINLSPFKERVFSEIFRVLKPGGELYFSDIFADRRIPLELRNDPVLLGECLGGALYREDFRRLMEKTGFRDHRITHANRVDLEDEEIIRKIGMVNFTSETIRAFKLEGLEDRCEDYGQIATYRGGTEESPHEFRLDDHHLFPKDKPVPVCGNTASMLEETRFGEVFTVSGDRSRHFGFFDCVPASDIRSELNKDKVSCC